MTEPQTDPVLEALRDEFAKALLPAAYAEFMAGMRNAEFGVPMGWRDGLADDIYRMADAMLKARQQ